MNRLAQLKAAPPRTAWPSLELLVTSNPVSRRTWRQACRCALQGLLGTWQSEPNFRLHVAFGVGISLAGIWCRLAPFEWVWIAVAVGFVIAAELLNTAIEGLVDLAVGLSPNPLARHVKDVAAGFVLVAAVLAVVIGALVFFPHVISR